MIARERPDKMEEECGVFGAWCPGGHAADDVYMGLLSLQHRGQESAGISISRNGDMSTVTGMGLISQVFNEEALGKLEGVVGIGHVRYSTTGDSSLENAQPLEGRCKLGTLSIAHNGNLVNADVVRSLLEDGGVLFRTTSDSEVILAMIARRADAGLEPAVVDTMKAVQGSFALVISVDDKLIGARDPFGIRPLCVGKKGEAWYLASESCALDAIGAELVRDVQPGEVIVIDTEGMHSYPRKNRNGQATCVFEYIYFARPDSVLDGVDVYAAREHMGRELFSEYAPDVDLVVGVPDSGVPAALGYSRASGIPYTQGFIKNRYVGRTFINPSQEMREKAVAVKLTVLRNEIAGNRVLLVDDSIVRGTTSRRLVNRLREAGAREVHFGVVSPPVISPCYFGIDTPKAQDLIASRRTVNDIAKEVGADSLAYLSREALMRALGRESGFCLGCLTGVYPIAPHQ